MKFTIAALTALSAVAIAAPAASYEEECDEAGVEHPKVEAVKYEVAPGHPSGPSYEAAPGHPSAPSYEAAPGHPSGPSYEAAPGHPSAPSYEAAPVHPSAPSYDAAPGHPSAPSYDAGKGAENCPKTECPAGGEKEVVTFPIEFTSTFSIVATPEQVVNTNSTATGGLPGAVGYYNFGLNSDLDLICYNITLVDVTGDYVSPADTATHIHQSAAGRSGPPRIAFPNPTIVAGSNIRQSFGCLSAPFVTGLEGADNVTDTGSASGFTLAQIEADPTAFNADVHTTDAVPGAVRGQFGAPLYF